MGSLSYDSYYRNIYDYLAVRHWDGVCEGPGVGYMATHVADKWELKINRDGIWNAELEQAAIAEAIAEYGEKDYDGDSGPIKATLLGDDVLPDKEPHYNQHPSGVECITVTEHMNFNLGNAVKYIWRCGLKDDEIKDLRKAAYYIEREIKLRGG